MSEQMLGGIAALSILLFCGIVVYVVFTMIDKRIEKKEENKEKTIIDILDKIHKNEFEIEKIDKFVKLKMMSGDSFVVSHKEFKTIGDSMKKDSYRIHRKAIESEYHYSEGYGYAIYKNNRVKLSITGDEHKNFTELCMEINNKNLEELYILGIRKITWDIENEKIIALTGLFDRYVFDYKKIKCEFHETY